MRSIAETSASTTPVKNISEAVRDEVQNLMVMTKLSGGVDAYLGSDYDLREAYVVLKGIPVPYADFVTLMAEKLRGGVSYETVFWERISGVWQAFGMAVNSIPTNNATHLANIIDDVAQFYSPPETETVGNFIVKQKVDYKPMMLEVHRKLTGN